MVLSKFTGSIKMDGAEDSLFKIFGSTLKHFVSKIYMKSLQAGDELVIRTYTKVDDVSRWKLDGDVTDSVGGNNGTVTNISSLVSQWKFDGDVLDSVGSNNGTITYNANLKRLYKFESNLNDTTGTANASLGAGTAIYVTGQEGNALSFDGSTWLSASDTGLPTGTNNFSLSQWIKPSTFASNPAFFAYGIGVGHVFRLWIDTTGHLQFNNASTDTQISTSALQLSVWQHLSVTYDGTNAKVYINGVLDKTTAITVNTTLVGAGGLTIGSWSGGSGTIFTGIMDEFRIYTIAVTQAQVSSLYMNGKFAQSHTFDNGEYMRVASNATLQSTSFTVSFWINSPTNNVQYAGIVEKYNSGTDDWFFDNPSATLNQIRFGMDTHTSGASTNGYTLPNGVWTHVTGSFDSSTNTLKFYINGTLQQTISSIAGTYTPSNNTQPFSVGSAFVGNFSTCQIDELRLYNAALSDSQVLGLYNYTGSNYIIPLPVGNALSLDGSSYVTVTNQTPYNFERTNSFSTSFWIKFTSNSAAKIISKRTLSGVFQGWFIQVNSGIIFFDLFGTTSGGNKYIEAQCSTINDGLWHNIVFTYSGNSDISGVNFYLDGVHTSFTTNSNNLGTNTIINTSNLVIGADYNGANQFTGLLDEVQIYNYVVSSAEINAINAGRFANTHPIGLWHFDGDLYDYSGQGSTGSPTGTMTYVTGALSGSYNVPNTHFNFDGSEYIALGNNSSLYFDGTKPFTTTFWIRHSSTVGTESVLDRQQPQLTGSAGYGIYLDSLPRIFFNIGTSAANSITVYNTTNIYDYLWHQIVITYDGSLKASGVSIYVDGVLQSSTIQVDNIHVINTTGINATIGAIAAGTFLLAGEIDDMRVYTRALSSAEVSDLYTYPDSAMKALLYQKTYAGVQTQECFIPYVTENQYMVTAQQTKGTNRIISWEREEVLA